MSLAVSCLARNILTRAELRALIRPGNKANLEENDMALIHHAIAAKAKKLGIVMTGEIDTVVAIDTKNEPDREWSGPNAKALLELVLSKRPKAVKPAAPAKPAKAV